MSDFKFALRNLIKKPAFSLMVIAMLAIGIAGNTAIFSIFNGLFLRPLPSPDPERLVDLDERAPRWNLQYTGIAYGDFHAWREQNKTFDGMAVWQGQSVNFSARGEAQRVRGAAVSHDLATVLGFKPVLGRDFLPEEDKPGATRVVLLSHGFWERQFSSDPKVLGTILQLNSEPFTVVGVLPPAAVFPAEADLWTPLRASPDERRGWYLSGVGRLKRGVSIEQAQADLLRIHKSLIPTRKVNDITSPVMQPLRERFLGEMRTAASLLLGGVGLVLLIACVNVAGLVLAHGASRTRELAIRAAVGASRGRIVRQLLTESVLLALTGGLVGTVLGFWAQRGMLKLVPQGVPRWLNFDVDLRFLAFCALITAAAAVIFGLAPALRAARVDVRGFLQEAAPRSTLSGRGRRGLNALVIAEIALATILLTGSGLLLQAFRKLLTVNPGFRPENTLTYSVALPGSKYGKEEQRIAFYRDLVDGVRSLPGVKSVGIATAPPLGGHWGNFFEVEGAPPLGPNEQDPVILQRIASPGYFEAIGLTFLAGRPFNATDGDAKNTRAVIVNESFAKRYWPKADAIGKRLRHRGASDWSEVVGVTKDVKHYGLDREMRPGLYFPYRQNPVNGMTVVVRTANDPLSLVTPARDLLRKLDADLPMYEVMTMDARLERSMWTRRAYSWLFGIFAVVALILAVAGAYGVLSYAVSLRTHEIGIRMALGAQPGHVLRNVLGQGMVLVAAGAALGVAIAAAAAQVLATLLFGVSPRDPVTYAIVIVTLAACALLANLVPARRAASVDPMVALRFE